MPRVTVCIPTLNRSTDLRHTIDAVLKQTYTDYEILIGDDASVDNTEEVVASYKDPRISYHRNVKNVGLYENWNSLIRSASGEFIAIYHDHDVYLPTILARSVELFEKYPTVNLVHTGFLTFDSNKRFVKLNVNEFPEFMPGNDFQRALVNRWSSPVLAATAMVRRTAYERVGMYSPESYGLWCDVDMWFQLGGIGDVAYVGDPEMLCRLRVKGQGTAIFNWANEESLLKMKEEHLVAAIGTPSLSNVIGWVRFGFRRDRRVLMILTRAFVMDEPQSVVDDGLRILKINAGFPAKLIGLALAGSPLLQRIAHRYLLPLYYERTLELGARQASAYLKTHDNISNYLQLFT